MKNDVLLTFVAVWNGREQILARGVDKRHQVGNKRGAALLGARSERMIALRVNEAFASGERAKVDRTGVDVEPHVPPVGGSTVGEQTIRMILRG